MNTELEDTQEIELEQYSKGATILSNGSTLETSKDAEDSDEIDAEISRLEDGDDIDTDEDPEEEDPDFEPTSGRGH